jgi:hypothetical protein
MAMFKIIINVKLCDSTKKQMATLDELRGEHEEQYKIKEDCEATLRGLLGCPSLAVPYCGRCKVLQTDHDCHIKDGMMRDLMCVKVGRPSDKNLPWQRGIDQLKEGIADMTKAITNLRADGKTGTAVKILDVNKVEEDDGIKDAMDEVLLDLTLHKNECRRLKGELHTENMRKMAVTRKQDSMEKQIDVLEKEMDELRKDQCQQLEDMMEAFKQNWGMGPSTSTTQQIQL